MGINIDHALVKKTIRETCNDTNPVLCFTALKQGFSLEVKSDRVVLTGNEATELLFTDFPSIYELINKLDDLGVTISKPMDYVATEVSTYLKELANTSIDAAAVSVKRKSYFSDETIDKILINYFTVYYPTEVDENEMPVVSEILTTSIDYSVFVHMVLWCSYMLLEEKRKNYATNRVLNEGLDTEDDSGMRNYLQTINSKTGDSFSVTENEVVGKDEDGFTALWGDKYSFYAKLQLFIRTKFEKLFKDYSLRDNVAVSINVPLDTHWSPFAYVNTKGLSSVSKDILSPNY